MPISLRTFRGESPRIAPRALGNEMSTAAINARLLSGNLEAWNDMSSKYVLGKAGPTNSMYLYQGQYWLSWADAELQNGAKKVDVVALAIAGDTTGRIVWTGTGKPQISNHDMALGGGVIPNGPYPVASTDLGVPAPTQPPVVVNTPGLSVNQTTTTSYTTQQTGWNVTYTGQYGSVTTLTSGGFPVLPYPMYDFLAQQDSGTWANIIADFGTSTCVQFTFDCDCSSTNGADLNEQQDVYVQLVSDGGGSQAIGFQIEIRYGGGVGSITYQDMGSGGAVTQIAPPGSVAAAQAVHISATCVRKPNDGTGVAKFLCSLVFTDAITHAAIANVSNITATSCGDAFTIFGLGGSNAPAAGHVFFKDITVKVTNSPNTFIPVFSSYVYTDANGLLLESAPSPASEPLVQVDNGNINQVTIPAPAVSVKVVYLYRAATGSSGTQFLQVVNGLYPDGGFPVCTVGGTNNAIALTDPEAAPNLQNTAYFFTATATSTGAVTVNGHATQHADGSAVGAGGIVNGQRYTATYERTVIQASQQDAASGTQQIVVASNAGLVNGMVVTDAFGAVPPGTTISNISGVNVTLSNKFTVDVTAGDLFYFADTSGKYTIESGYTYRDATPTAQLGAALESADWDPPPDNMIGIIPLPNEVLAGFVGNTLCLSVPGQPQAWPLANQYATDSPIVALVALGINVGILTQGRPYTAYGTDPSAMQMGFESVPQGCESARGVCYSREHGGLYPSTDGIYAYAGFGQINNLTMALFTKREWQALNPSTITGIVHQGMYFFWYQTLAGAKLGKCLDLRPDGSLVSWDFHAIAAALDSSDDNLYVVLNSGNIEGGAGPANNELCQWEGSAAYRPGSWTSKVFENAYEMAYTMQRIRAGNYAGLTTQLSGDGHALSLLTPVSKREFTIEPLAASQHQFTIAWSTSNPSVETQEYVEKAEELT